MVDRAPIAAIAIVVSIFSAFPDNQTMATIPPAMPSSSSRDMMGAGGILPLFNATKECHSGPDDEGSVIIKGTRNQK